MTYSHLYIEFLYYFNIDKDYFECHEVLEELWLEEGRTPLYQGLLQVAVGLHHYSYGNATGAIKLFTAGVEKLEMFPVHDLGIDLDKVKRDAAEYINKLREIERTPLEFYVFNIDIKDPQLKEKVEELRLNPPTKHDEPTDL